MIIDKKDVTVTRRDSYEYGSIDYIASYTIHARHTITQDFVLQNNDEFVMDMTNKHLYEMLDNHVNGDARVLIRKLYDIAMSVNRNQRIVCDEDILAIREKSAELDSIANEARSKGLW